MATITASRVFHSESATQIQNALATLPAPPTSILSGDREVRSPTVEPSASSKLVSTAAASIHPQSRPTPPATPTSRLSSEAISHCGPTAAIPGTLTPQVSIKHESSSTRHGLLSTASSTAFQNCHKLQEAYIEPFMQISPQIDAQWRRGVRGYLDEVLRDTIRSRCVQQELIYAAPRGLFRRPKEMDLKPTIVVSVVSSEDRKRVKKRIKKLDWLQKEIRDCQLRLMVVIDQVKLMSDRQIQTISSSTIQHRAFLALDSTRNRLCGQQLRFSCPSEITGESVCALGGVIVIDDVLCGLTAGHGFFPGPVQTASEATVSLRGSEDDAISDQWLENPRNPFVWEADDIDNAETETEDRSSSLDWRTNDDLEDSISATEQRLISIPRVSVNNGVQCTVVTPRSPSMGTNMSRNCDWALVGLQLPLSLNANAFRTPNTNGDHLVRGTKLNSEYPNGQVWVIFSPENVACGQLSSNSVSYSLGPYLFDVRLVVLQQDIQSGFSGAWVVQDDLLCGYIISARSNPRWAYMMPIQDVIEDIQKTLGAQNIRLPTDHDLWPGRPHGLLTDLLTKTSAVRSVERRDAAAGTPLPADDSIRKLGPARSVSDTYTPWKSKAPPAQINEKVGTDGDIEMNTPGALHAKALKNPKFTDRELQLIWKVMRKWWRLAGLTQKRRPVVCYSVEEWLGRRIQPGDRSKTQTANKEQPQQDPNVVDWERDDRDNPQNWTSRKKWLLVSMLTVIYYFVSTGLYMISPVIPLIMEDFDTTDETIGTLIITIPSLGQAAGLLLVLRYDIWGQLPLQHAHNILSTIMAIACALSPNMTSLLVFRFLAGLVTGAFSRSFDGVIESIFVDKESRLAPHACARMVPALSLIVAPVLGAYVAQAGGWRWVFWVFAIAVGCMSFVGFITLAETYEPVLLERRVKRLRKETGNNDLRSKLQRRPNRKEHIRQSLVKPVKILLLSPIISSFSLCDSIIASYGRLLYATSPFILETRYGFSQGSVGLSLMSIGIGYFIGLLMFGLLLSSLSRRMVRTDGIQKPEQRLPVLIVGNLLAGSGLFWYGWSAQAHLHWIMPTIGMAWTGLGVAVTVTSCQSYLMDCFKDHADSVFSATTFVLNLVCGSLPLAGPALYKLLGFGWGNSLFGFMALLMIPGVLLLCRYGASIRRSNRWSQECM